MVQSGFTRPSTYAPTISTIQQRQYVVKGDKRLVCAALGVLAALTSFSAMGVPYLSSVVFSGDGIIRRNYRALSRRPFTIWKRRGS